MESPNRRRHRHPAGDGRGGAHIGQSPARHRQGPGALAAQVETWRLRHDTAAAFAVTGTPRALPADVDEAVLRACQEGLSNAARHAGAAQLGVTLSYMEDLVVLDIRDDGRGFTATVTGGFGLKAMRQRAHSLGGDVRVESSPGNGTAVSVSIPLTGVAL
ncbi:sensor histidine kinase [Phytomonospora endophytica]|uniref:histidine kinase n=1 Tax=Phytomonospora endophytica TaxID=714109 RepID=A0A841FJZ7_9ACTN|nr:ATP-binding protein [Phytomonospora endophytica]MBB6036204.1 signal transduction histidine kinase [Phytomonospora endophytica]GIG67110.1 hypothetical protein Pen01_34050 [Phytomonospora endophytica]